MSVTIASPIPGAGAPPLCALGFSAARVGTPTTSPARSTSAPPLFPGLIAALVWTTSGRVAPGPPPAPEGSVTLRPPAETMPFVTLPVRPSGLPAR